jgi:hypothetical protein
MLYSRCIIIIYSSFGTYNVSGGGVYNYTSFSSFTRSNPDKHSVHYRVHKIAGLLSGSCS